MGQGTFQQAKRTTCVIQVNNRERVYELGELDGTRAWTIFGSTGRPLSRPLKMCRESRVHRVDRTRSIKSRTTWIVLTRITPVSESAWGPSRSGLENDRTIIHSLVRCEIACVVLPRIMSTVRHRVRSARNTDKRIATTSELL